MAIIVKPNTFTAGTTAKAAEVNSNFDTLYNDYNGNITTVNLSSSAGIKGSQIDLSTAGAIGSVAPSTGAFTTLTASGTLEVTGAATLTGGVAGALSSDTSLELATGATVTGIADEDDMTSDSATLLATQQSIKAYVDPHYDSGWSAVVGGSVSNTFYSFAHGLASIPTRFEVYAKCTMIGTGASGDAPTVTNIVCSMDSNGQGTSVNVDDSDFYLLYKTNAAFIADTGKTMRGVNNANADLQFRILAWA